MVVPRSEELAALVPPGLTELLGGRPAAHGVAGADWLAHLPRLVGELLDLWELTPSGPPMHGEVALVLPVLRGSVPAVLKVSWPDPESEQEHLALQAWGGRGAVRLLAADPSRWGLLLERLDQTDLESLDPVEGCGVAGALVPVLDRPALPQLPRLSDIGAAWLAELRGPVPRGVPRRFVEQSRSLLTDLLRDEEVDARLVHRDLHYGNVLRSPSGQWLAIDPKPVAGTWALGAAPMIWNRADVALSSPDPRWALHCRIGAWCDAAGVDEDRARAWTIVRTVRRLVGSTDAQWSSWLVTVLKSMQPAA